MIKKITAYDEQGSNINNKDDNILSKMDNLCDQCMSQYSDCRPSPSELMRKLKEMLM